MSTEKVYALLVSLLSLLSDGLFDGLFIGISEVISRGSIPDKIFIANIYSESFRTNQRSWHLSCQLKNK